MTFRNSWIEFSTGFGFKIMYEVAGYFDVRPMLIFCLGWGRFYIHLPFNTGISECEPPRYGFYWFESALWICKGHKTIALYAPWSWDWHRTSYLQKNEKGNYGEWISERKGERRDLSPWKDPLQSKLWSENYPYEYQLKSGVIQKLRATVTISEREWRRRLLMWCPWFNKVVRSLDVNFDGEVGEESGSWKGGCIGCSTTILPGEEPLTVLRRMEKTRKF